MTKIGSFTPQIWRQLPPCRVPPPPPCPPQSLGEHRLRDYPVITDLLGHLAGDIPFSTHLQIENARSRAVERALQEALDRLPPPEPARDESPLSTTANTPAADPAARPPDQPMAARQRPEGAVEPERVFTQRRERWPIGGLIDLVI